jgi:hypothetical protein
MVKYGKAADKFLNLPVKKITIICFKKLITALV